MRANSLAILAAFAVALSSPEASAACVMSYCKDGAATSTPSRRAITNEHRQTIGDVYDPGHGRRVQIRDTDRRILFYIEKDGTITDTHRRKVGKVEGLR